MNPYIEPAVEKRVCYACTVFTPNVWVPTDDGATPMCWLCAHHVVEHELTLAQAASARCACPLHAIYPKESLALHGLGGTVDASDAKAPEYVQPDPAAVNSIMLVGKDSELGGGKPRRHPLASRGLERATRFALRKRIPNVPRNVG